MFWVAIVKSCYQVYKNDVHIDTVYFLEYPPNFQTPHHLSPIVIIDTSTI